MSELPAGGVGCPDSAVLMTTVQNGRAAVLHEGVHGPRLVVKSAALMRDSRRCPRQPLQPVGGGNQRQAGWVARPQGTDPEAVQTEHCGASARGSRPSHVACKEAGEYGLALG